MVSSILLNQTAMSPFATAAFAAEPRLNDLVILVQVVVGLAPALSGEAGWQSEIHFSLGAHWSFACC